MTLTRLLPCLLSLSLILAAAGCGNDEAESPAAPDVDQEAVVTPDNEGEGFAMSFKGKDGKSAEIKVGGENGFSMNIQGEDGVQMKVGEDAAMPADFPKDVPTYKNMKLNLSQASADGFVVQGTVADDVDTVAAFFKAQAVANGWEEESSFSTSGEGALMMLNYKKGERTLNVSISHQDNQTMIQLATNG